MRLLTLLSFAIVAMAGCANIGDFDSVPAPVWEAGYAYSYDVEGGLSASGHVEFDGERQDIPPEDFVIERQPLMAYQVLGTDVAIDGEPVYAAGALLAGMRIDMFDDDIRTLDVNGFGIRQRDLFIIDGLDGLTDCDGCTSTLTEGLYLDFPLTPGKEWRTVEEDDGLRITTVSTAVDMERLPLLDASLDAVRVEHAITLSLTPEGRQEIEEELGGTASISGGGKVITWYAPALGNIIKEDYDVNLRVSASGSQDGHSFSFAFNMATKMIVTMTGADLSPMADRDAAAVKAYLDSNGPLNDPSGRLAAPLGDYTISIDQTDDRVNAFQAPGIGIAVNVDGELPEGHTIRVAHVKPDGTTTVTEGSDVSLTIDAAGVHQVLAQAYHGQVMQARASAQIIADYEGTLTTGCGPATLMASCAAVTVPVGAGWESLQVFAHNERNAPVMAPGDLVVSDAYGNSVETRGSNARITDPNLIADGSAWRMQWSPDVAVADSAVYEISITYPGDAVEVDAEPASISVKSLLGLAAERVDLPEPLAALLA